MSKMFRSRIVVTILIAALLSALNVFFAGETSTSAGRSFSSLRHVAPTATIKDDFLPADFAKSEVEGIGKFVPLLLDYKNHLDTARNNANPNAKQLGELESQLKTLRSSFPQFQNNARAVITKLKNAHKWTSELDTYFETVAARKNLDPQFVDLVKSGGGFRSSLEKSIGSLGRVVAELDRDEAAIKELKAKKISWLNWLESFGIPAANAAAFQLSCDTCLTIFVHLEICALVAFLPPGCGAAATAYGLGRCARSECRNFSAQLIWKGSRQIL